MSPSLDVANSVQIIWYLVVHKAYIKKGIKRITIPTEFMSVILKDKAHTNLKCTNLLTLSHTISGQYKVFPDSPLPISVFSFFQWAADKSRTMGH